MLMIKIIINLSALGIICNSCDVSIFDWKTGEKLDNSNDRQFLRSIREAIENKSYCDIKIYTRNAPLPTLGNILEN